MLWKTFAIHSPTLYRMGEMKRAIARETEQFQRDRFASTLVVTASIICAVRLAYDDIRTLLARIILKRVVG